MAVPGLDPGIDPAIHVFLAAREEKTWMSGMTPATTQ